MNKVIAREKTKSDTTITENRYNTKWGGVSDIETTNPAYGFKSNELTFDDGSKSTRIWKKMMKKDGSGGYFIQAKQFDDIVERGGNTP